MLKKKKAPKQTAAQVASTQKTTERKELVDELWLKNIVFETSAAANSMADNQGNINHVNAAFLRLWGYRTEEEAMGKSVASFFSNVKDAEPVMESLSTTGRWEGEFLAKRTDGSTFITRGAAIVIRDESGKQIGYHSSNIDVTGERRAQEELKEKNEEMEAANQELSAANEELIASEEELKANEEELQRQNEELVRSQAELKDSESRLHLLIDGVKDYGLYMLDTGGTVVSWNEGAERMKGYRSEEIIGQSFSKFFTPEDQQNNTSQRLIDAATTQGRVEDEGWRVRKDGSRFWADAIITALYAPDGSLQGFAKITRDLTENKRAEDQLKQLNEELELRVQQRTIQLEASNNELESFAYSVSHDLRVPLRAIDGFTKIITEDYKEIFDEEGKRLLGVIRTNTRKMGQLIEDLLLFSKVGRQELAGIEIDMRSLAETVSKEFKVQNEGRNIIFKTGSLPSSKGDPAMLRQVLANLVGNAVKFTRPREEALVEIAGTTQGSENIYSVKDNGVGFDMQYVSKLFGVFQRLHSQVEFEGTGVGLAIVQRIILKHGGRVWAEGKVGEGATLFFALPNTAQQQG
ncbi:MAG: PAS domain S-box protein [Candidatus Edwardsbacteria bacterium]|nr:PAS domain S-box protein [Candidatus Edwardsbacteria bacterium]MBU1577119.1 PAS domain S-box protein [Candidatus Edwardsbacteria bacterium]MBU2463803.1 PAS domain S-box protein [Candidatus Edwardsbacteria bacterium]MBU2593785.1 PAS domain S-box protein [Candidatus Edwardsbacteria bacterium]